MSERKKNTRRLQFGLWTLLAIATCLAVYFGAARIGYHRGYKSGQLQRASEIVVVRIYEVGDLVDSPSRMDDLVYFITTTVEPGSWDAAGGRGVKKFQPTRLVVSQNEDAHKQINAILRYLREAGAKGSKSRPLSAAESNAAATH